MAINRDSDPGFDVARYHALRRSRTMGARVSYAPSTASTMDDARSGAARDGLDSCGAAYVAGHQTSARGRQGRSWSAERGAGLYVTYHFCATPSPRLPERLPLLAVTGALATADAIADVTPLRPELKWPNDVLLDGRKLAGILAEAVHGAGHDHAGIRSEVDVFMGIGINLRPHPDWSPEVAALATSIEQGHAVVPDIEVLLAALSGALESWRDRLDADPPAVIDAWKQRLVTLGRRVRLAQPDGTVTEGEAVGVSPTGDLVLRHPDGATSAHAAGDVHSV